MNKCRGGMRGIAAALGLIGLLLTGSAARGATPLCSLGYQLKPGQPIKSTSCVAWQFSAVTPQIVPA